MSASNPPEGNVQRPTVKAPPTGTLTASAGRTQYKYKMHWHVLLMHFPISFFVGSFGFMALHLITQKYCFHLAAYVSLIAGATIMIPTTLTGWRTWKNRYQGIRGKLFLRKIWISFVMIAVSIALVAYQTLFPSEFLEIFNKIHHAIYFIGMTLLLLGAIAEGYYGGRLTHR